MVSSSQPTWNCKSINGPWSGRKPRALPPFFCICSIVRRLLKDCERRDLSTAHSRETQPALLVQSDPSGSRARDTLYQRLLAPIETLVLSGATETSLR